jgi:hypothetical protein
MNADAYVSNSNSHTPPTFLQVPQMTNHRMSKRAFIAAGITAAAGLRAFGTTQAYAEPETTSGLPDKGGTAPWDYWQSNEGEVRFASRLPPSFRPTPTTRNPGCSGSTETGSKFSPTKIETSQISIPIVANSIWGWGARSKTLASRRHLSGSRRAFRFFRTARLPIPRPLCNSTSRSVHS